jgi:DNA repair exonuclease SbcCD ATPase subunit
MIKRLELHRWRSFESVGITFEPGTTFLVAPNGVGKTSLLLGLTWALFGDHSSVDAKTCVRLGHETAETVLVLDISDGRELAIHRTINRSGKSAVDYRIGEVSISPPTAEGWLTQDFGTPMEIASRLAVIRGSGQDTGELQLREHLYNAFGITGLRDAAAQASKLHKQAETTRKKLRSASRTQLSNRGQLQEQATALEGELETLRGKREPLADALEAALRTRQAASDWETYESQLAARVVAQQDLLREASRELEADTFDELGGEITKARETARVARDQVQRVVAEAQAQAFAARSAIDLLEGHDPSCPTCARPFHDGEFGQALAAQTASLTIAQDRIEQATEELERLRVESDSLDDINRRFTALSEPMPVPSTQRPIEDVDKLVDSAQKGLQAHDEEAGSVSARLAAMTQELESDDELQAAYEAERAAWQREALTRAAAQALAAAAERLATEQIEPISNQVRWRWKALFGEDGLQLRPNGTIVRVVGDRELPWSQLSSGEQIWARLVASLLVLRASTTIPFAWLDEPLEHLDPRARRIVASDIAKATRSGRPAQMIVTTYEHTLVRQLAEDLPDTHVRYINHSEIPPGIALAGRYREKMSAIGSLSSVDESAIDDLLGPRP